MEAKATGEPGWKWRRLAIFPVVAFACWRLMMMESAPDTRLNDTIAFGWQVLIVVLVGGFTGFATLQDIAAIWATRSALPYSPASSPIDPAVATADASGAAPCHPLQNEFTSFEPGRSAG